MCVWVRGCVGVCVGDLLVMRGHTELQDTVLRVCVCVCVCVGVCVGDLLVMRGHYARQCLVVTELTLLHVWGGYDSVL